jgi:DNA-binding CsgD family transcriptional regulator
MMRLVPERGSLRLLWSRGRRGRVPNDPVEIDPDGTLHSGTPQATTIDVMRLLERELELAAVRAFVRRGGVLVVEGRAGMGKTAILDATCIAAQKGGRLVLRARGSDLEGDFAFGIARQLLERGCTETTYDERAALFSGSAGAARALVMRRGSGRAEEDTSFAIVHGLYWLVVNLATRRPILLAVDDAHWGDDASLRWLAYLAARLDGIKASLVVSLRPHEPRSQDRPLLAVRAAASATVRPGLLSEQAVTAIAHKMLGIAVEDDLCVSIHRATGGNPFYVLELVRGLKRADHPRGARVIEDAVSRGDLDGVALQLGARLRNLSPHALRLAQAIAILGDGCELRHAATISQTQIAHALSLATELVRLDVLGEDRPPRFIHPIVQHAVLQTLSSAEHDAAHRAAASVLYAEHLPPGRIAAHVKRLRAVGDPWAVERLCEGARAALENGAPAAAADLLERALAEPPPAEVRVEVLRAAARAQLQAGRAFACQRLEEAVAITEGRQQAELASELAQTYATLFRWVDAVHVLERALDLLGKTHRSLAAHLQSQLVAAGLQDARVAARALQAMEHMSPRRLSGSSAAGRAVAQGMVAIFTGQPADAAARPLERALTSMGAPIQNWDALAALWWCLLTAERFDTVAHAIESVRERADCSGSSRGLVAVYSTLGLLNFRLGALPEADAAARIALQVVQEGDFAPGLAFAATVLADVAVASGQFDEAQALLDLLPHGSLPPGVGTVLIPAGRGRLRLAQGRADEALAEFEACMALWRPDVWGMEMRDVGYVHARSGAAQALLALGDTRRARELAEAELADVRRFGGRRALGVALRVSGLARGGMEGLGALEGSVAVLSESPAALERARSLVELGSVLRRAGRRRDARKALSQGLDLAARCGARPLIAYAREELRIAGARPRRDWTRGVEALTASELRIVRLAREGRSNRQIAQDLYLSIKTVEGHLARAYGKLDITTRSELERALEPEKARVPTL